MTEPRAIVPADDSRLDLGQTQLRAQDIILPRVKVIQQMSQEATDKKGDPGDFYNTLTGEVLDQPLLIQPILPVMNRVFLIRSERRADAEHELGHELSEGDGLKCRSFDMIVGRGEPGGECELCPLSAWREGNKPPLCTELYNVAASTMIGELIIMSFSKSSAKAGKRFFSAIRLSGTRPWSMIYELTTTRQTNDKGTFYVPDFKRSAEKPDNGQLAQALAWAQQLRGVVIAVSPEEDEPGNGHAAPSDEGAPF